MLEAVRRTNEPRNRLFTMIGLVTLAGITVLGLSMAGFAAQDPPDPISVRALTDRHAFTDAVGLQWTLMAEGRSQEVIDLSDASSVTVLELTVQPGAMFPWHTHPGPVVVTVLEGDFVYMYSDDCLERPYSSGTAFLDPGFDNVHIAFNPSESEVTVLIAVFFGAPDEGPVTLPVSDDQQDALSEQCDIRSAARSH